VQCVENVLVVCLGAEGIVWGDDDGFVLVGVSEGGVRVPWNMIAGTGDL
jgi:hypothetical protein